MSDKKPMNTIQHYESMTTAEIKAELNRHDIDVEPTIKAVKAIVARHLHHQRRGHHHAAPMIHASTRAVTCGNARLLAFAPRRDAAHPRGVFSVFDEVAERLHGVLTLDHAYVESRAVTDAAIRVRLHRQSWDPFANAWAELHDRCALSVRRLLAHALRHWCHLGPRMRELAMLTAAEAALQLHDGAHNPMSGIHDVKAWALQQASNRASPMVSALHALEPIRETRPRFAATLFAELVFAATGAARLAVFAFMVEGYERLFAGRRQLYVPQFELSHAPHFLAGAQHELDLFGHHVCHSEHAHALFEEMEWANARLRLWA